MFDSTDLKILALLQDNARTPNAEIARQVGLAPSAIFERLRKLEESGVIEGYAVRLNAKVLGLGLVAYVFVGTGEKVGCMSAARDLAQLPEVLEVHNIAGDDCYLIKVRVESPEALGRLLREKIGAIPTIQSTRTTIVMDTYKETTRLPLPSAKEKRHAKS